MGTTAISGSANSWIGNDGINGLDGGNSQQSQQIQQIEQFIQALLQELFNQLMNQQSGGSSDGGVGGPSGASGAGSGQPAPASFYAPPAGNAPPPAGNAAPPAGNAAPPVGNAPPPAGNAGAPTGGPAGSSGTPPVVASGAPAANTGSGSGSSSSGNYAFLSGGKEGLGISPTSANGNGSNMGDSSWYSNWSLQSTGNAKGQFIPTVFNTNDASNEGQLESAFKNSGSPLAFTYNEPDNAGQSNISVGDAVKSWSNIATAASNTGTQLASPSVTNSTSPGQGLDWLKQFMNSDTTVNGQTKKVGDTVSAINLHWYGSASNPNDPGQVSQCVNDLKNYLQQAHSEFPDKPIVLSEFGLNPNGNSAASSPEFLKQAEQMLNSLPYVEMYAPYGLGTPGGNAGASGAA